MSEEEEGAVSDLPVEQEEERYVSVSVPDAAPVAAADAVEEVPPAVWMRRREEGGREAAEGSLAWLACEPLREMRTSWLGLGLALDL
jgi:hypothetical protein